MLNPFNLSGPEFLLFYAAAVLLAFILFRRDTMRRRAAKTVAIEKVASRYAQAPYLIASLHGDRDRIIQVAILALTERGLLRAESGLLVAGENAADHSRRPLDKAILRLYRKSAAPGLAFTDDIIGTEVRIVRLSLAAFRKYDRAGNAVLVTVVVVLLALALLRIVLSLAHGHNNVLFLLAMAAAMPFLLRFAATDNTAALVRDAVARRFASLYDHASSLQFDAGTGKVTFFVAAFGFSNLPRHLAASLREIGLAPPEPPTAVAARSLSFSGSSSCGSSSCCFPSSSGSSCGGSSSCGGCGGGCS
ncbi:MAG: TIGR04222 domain-containing membrane protein [Alphaproteobacteria bacterium]|nr:TIGR04222 domain-containing membrane protein [Alphaproteobacteria bacterium]